MKSKYSRLSIFTAVLLLIVLLFEVKLHVILKYLFTFLLIFIISNMLSKNMSFSLILSSVILVILFLMDNNNKNTFENIENFENDKQRIAGEKGLDKILEKLDNGIKLEEEDITEHNNIKNESFDDKKDNLDTKGNIEDYTPQQAQHETFKLIDTVKQLKHTIEALAPTLREGKQILSSFEALKI